jgi:hypothetical protein
MINYTERIALLMQDVVVRTPRLSFIDLREVLVFGRFGRSDAEGAFATCHCLTLPESEPGYYFWRDRSTGQLTRRSEWFVTKSPQVRVGGTAIKYLISFVLPRFCDQSLDRSRKWDLYPAGTPGWLAKLDTIVHELYHIDPERPGIRRMERADGTYSANCHGQRFFTDVVEMVQQYVATNPDPAVYDFLEHDYEAIQARFGGMVGTTFRGFPSYPQRFTEVLTPQPDSPPDVDCRVEPLKVARIETAFTEDDLVMREFMPTTSRQLLRKGRFCAA